MNSGHWSRQLLERGGVGGVARLGLLAAGEAALGEQQLAQLDGRVEVQVVPTHHPPQLGTEALDLLDQADVDRAQHLAIDRDADVLHAGQHAHERVLDVAVEPGHALRLEGGLDRTGDVMHGERLAPGELRHVEGAAVEIELARRGTAAAGGRERRELLDEVGERVPRLGGVDEIGDDGGVEPEPGQVVAEIEQRPHERLGVVTADVAVGGHDRRHRFVGDQLARNPRDVGGSRRR